MAMMTVLSEDEARRIAEPILRKYLQPFGYGGVSVSSEEDFDGAIVLRMSVNVERQVSGRAMVDVVGAIREALLDRGDERFAFLSYRRPDTDPAADAGPMSVSQADGR
ncbi:hypothetical protein [Aurantimonas sp. 22II-16-19i]|uniref:hypothetical protein n=1 Tax=Aurantimonas sp. 22II-16-19i TaxID=1317114 RepID=UPI0009F7F886|nr:hypothetical protein [Aurantimonas sp. 22II-16-19i]ORE92340.1 hypothetical protein ATO4_17502 [Aurantimonas sp. 22II-16-19i]